MPYFISDQHPDCSGWGLLKEDGELIFCHPNKEAATNHMIAISLAEGIEPAGEYDGETFRAVHLKKKLKDAYKGRRDGLGQPAIILDIDNTLIRDGEFQRSVYDYALTFENTLIYIVTARLESQRADTEAELLDFGVAYSELFMKPNNETDSTEFKTQIAQRLLQTHNVMVAIDDSTPIRNAYAELGILAIHPDQTPKANPSEVMGRSFRAALPGDKFTTQAEALARAEQLGCEGTHSMDEDGETIYMPCSTHGRYEELTGTTDSGYRMHTPSHNDPASTPAPKEDQVEGSDTNKPGSASGAGGDIELSEATETALRNKVTAHNEQMEEESKPRHTRTTYGQLAAVYRRGAGAFSVSHRPGMTRAQWAMARVNAFLYLLRNERPESAAYITDNDLLPEGHPKSTRSFDVIETRDVDLSPPSYMMAAARRGVALYEEGKAGDGVTEQTIREARAMANGNVTADKYQRISAWIARHLPDLDAPQNQPGNDDFPGPGAVAFLLWGATPTQRGAERTRTYAEGITTRIEQENEGRARGKALGKLELRTNPSEFEIRDEGEQGMRFTGYAAVFNSASQPLPFTERIAPGAFKRTIKDRNDIKLLWNHDTGTVLGSTRAGTLTLIEDSIGLRVEALLPPTTAGRDLSISLKRRDVDAMSFGFTVPTGGDSWSADGQERTLNSIRLHEVSIVPFPAYTATAGTASVRGLDKIAKRADVDADALADALIKLETGEDITPDDLSLLDSVIKALAPQEPEPEPEDNGKALLELKKMKLAALMKAI